MTHRKFALATAAVAGALALAGCTGNSEQEGNPGPDPAPATSVATDTAAGEETSGGSGHQHNPEGGPPPEGIEPAADPTYPVGTTVTLTADHMPGMDGAEATITGAFDTTAYAVSYTPTTGGEPVTNHKWVVHEELEDPGQPPLEPGTEVVLSADHMMGMDGAEATIDSSTDETVYMVDTEINGMEMTNHKWVVESEIQPAG